MLVTKQEIITKLKRLKRVSNQVDYIYCDNINAISYCDILELFLHLSGLKNWEWIDCHGRTVLSNNIYMTIIKIIQDIILWPIIYLNNFFKIYILERKIDKIKLHCILNTEYKILFLRTDHWFNIKSGGSVGHIAGVVNGFKSLNLKVNVVSSDDLTGIENDEYFHKVEPIYGHGRNLPNIPELIYNNQLLHYIDEYWKILNPAFIYQRYSLGNYIGVILRNKYKIPYICEYNGSFTWMAKNWDNKELFHKKLLNKIEILNLKAADLVVVVSEVMKNELIKRGIDEDKILINPNGVNPKLYSPLIDGSKVRNLYNIGDKIVCGFIGTFGKWHGAEVLVESFGQFLLHNPSYVDKVLLLLIGDGVTMPLIKENICKYHIEKQCILTGLVPQEQGPQYLAACDILLSPHVPNPDGTPFFGSPTKLFEYMAMGKGIIASDIEQIGKILRHNYTSWMAKPGDINSLEAGLKKLIEDETLRRRLGFAAREEVCEKYTWQEHTRKIIKKLKNVRD